MPERIDLAAYDYPFGRRGRTWRALRWPRMKVAITAVAALALCSFAAGAATRPHTLAGCAMFPANNPWNQRVDTLPVASNSDAIIATIGAGTGLHPDFGSG